MELRHLVYFVAVAEELHFARAATRLQMAQQPLSQQIRRLEQELGVTLFHRTTRKVELTYAGQVFLEESRRTLGQAAHAVHITQRAERGEIGRVVIGYVSTTLYNIFPQTVREFHTRFPQVTLVLRELCSPELEEMVLNGQLDVGFVGSPTQEPALCAESLWREPVMVVLPEGHPLAAQTHIPLSALAQEPFIQYDREQKQYAHDQIVAVCYAAGFSPHVVQEAATEQAIISLVGAGLGVSVVSASLQELRSNEVVYCQLINPSVEVEFSMIWRRDSVSPVIPVLAQVARERAMINRVPHGAL